MKEINLRKYYPNYTHDVMVQVPDEVADLLQELARALKPGGRVVVLTAAKDELLSAAEAVPQLTLNARYNLLVSGKKAGLFLLNR